MGSEPQWLVRVVGRGAIDPGVPKSDLHHKKGERVETAGLYGANLPYLKSIPNIQVVQKKISATKILPPCIIPGHSQL